MSLTNTIVEFLMGTSVQRHAKKKSSGGVPGQGAAAAQSLILHIASENVLGSLQEHGERHARDVALLRGRNLVAEGKLQQCLEAHLRKLLPHPHIDLCLCKHKTIRLLDYFTDAALSRVIYGQGFTVLPNI